LNIYLLTYLEVYLNNTKQCDLHIVNVHSVSDQLPAK